jgi:hypothetical protein
VGSPPQFSAEPHALNQAQQNQQNGRCDADLLVGGEEADEEGAKPHDDDRRREHGLAAERIAEMPKDRGAQGSRELAGTQVPKDAMAPRAGLDEGRNGFVKTRALAVP